MASPDAAAKKRLAAGRVEEFTPGKPRLVPHGRRGIGVYRVDDTFRAVLDFCPHEGIKICTGQVGGTFGPAAPGQFRPEREGCILTCPWHGWQFDLHTGASVHDPACRLKTFPTEVEDGVVYVLV